MANEYSGFSGYRQTVFALREDLQKLRDYSDKLGMEMLCKSIDEVLKKAIDDSFDVAVIGEFRRGKSTLINALLGKPILPSDVLPTTATLNRVTYDIEQYIDIEYHDGTSEERVPLEMLDEYVTKITSEAEEKAMTIKEAVVHYPTSFCKNNVDIIDTPGLNDDNCMTNITLSVIPNVDAAIFVIMGPAPFGMYERDFLEKKMLTSDIGRVIFVVTRMDEYTPEQAERLLENIKEERIKSILVKAKNVYGEDSQEYKDYESKLGNIKMIGVSAKQALAAKQTGDTQLLEKSNFLTFEETLEKLLTEERGALVLSSQASKIISACADIFKTIELRENALNLDSEEFDQKYDEALKKIENLRNQRECELKKIQTAAKEAEAEVRPLINSFSSDLKNNALSIIEDEIISSEDIKTKEGQQEVQEYILGKIRESNEEYSQILAERMQHTIEKCSGREIERLSEYETKFYAGMNDIQTIFNPVETGVDGVGIGAGGAVLSSVFLGGVGGIGGAVGGAVSGYKQGGITGALVGGGVAAVGTIAANVLLTTTLTAIGITPVGWIVFPILALAGAAGMWGGKFAVSKLFKRDHTAEFKEALKKAVSDSYDNSSDTSALENKIIDHIRETFSAIETRICNETETILVDTENTLEDLKSQLAEKRVLTQKNLDDLTEMIENVSGINKRACELSEYIITVLTKEE